MSLEAILAAIEALGESEVAALQADTLARAAQLLAEAERRAAAGRERARRTALRPASGERSRTLHQARLEALHLRGKVRDRLVEAALAQTRARLASLRADPSYPRILEQLVEEAVDVLGEEQTAGSPPRLEVDPRDEALLRGILRRLQRPLPVEPVLECWGGVVARSGDGRIVATNTLEARLERATPFLRRDLAVFIEQELATDPLPQQVPVGEQSDV